MPTTTKTVPPKVFLQHGDLTIYHLYIDDNVDNGPRTHHFTFDVEGSDDYWDCPEAGNFDLRDVPGYEEAERSPEQHWEHARAIIRAALDTDYFEEWVEYLKAGYGD